MNEPQLTFRLTPKGRRYLKERHRPNWRETRAAILELGYGGTDSILAYAHQSTIDERTLRGYVETARAYGRDDYHRRALFAKLVTKTHGKLFREALPAAKNRAVGPLNRSDFYAEMNNLGASVFSGE